MEFWPHHMLFQLAEYDFAGADEFDIDTDFFGIGFQFETNPLSANSVFSYRFQAGFESRNIEDDDGAKCSQLQGQYLGMLKESTDTNAIKQQQEKLLKTLERLAEKAGGNKQQRVKV
ncbi:MAG: hypothetical protein JRF32_05080 [Deltaproteobacteria bacterium]|nr:hypothetical protein [Deltaproteobacteria bacterium]